MGWPAGTRFRRMVTARMTARATARWIARLSADPATVLSRLMSVGASCSRVALEPLQEREPVHTSSSQVHPWVHDHPPVPQLASVRGRGRPDDESHAER
jgi:hypothetical protein